jgi:hypothetical protein
MPVIAHRIVFAPSYLATIRKLGRDEALQQLWECCLEPACTGAPGAEQELALPPARIGLPNGKRFEGYW